MKAKAYIIRIPNPCNEDWNNMRPVENGRFCKVCNKTVTDFTGKSDEEIGNFLWTHKEQKICGRFNQSQVERPIHIRICSSQLPRNLNYTTSFAIAIFLVFGTFLFSCTGSGGERISKVEYVSTESNYSLGAPISSEDEKPVGFQTAPHKKSASTATVESLPAPPEPQVAGGLSFVQAPVQTLGGAPEIVEYHEPPSQLDTSMAWQFEAQLTAFISPDSNLVPQAVKHGFSVYPNPGRGQFTLNYELQKKANVRVDLFDVYGAWVQTIVHINGQHAGNYSIPFETGSLPDGIYQLNMIAAGERTVEKLVIKK